MSKRSLTDLQLLLLVAALGLAIGMASHLGPRLAALQAF
jgi:hypothetical protein